MRKSGNRCFKCGHFIQYYERGTFSYFPCGYGFCNNKSQFVEEDSDCKSFYKKVQSPLKAEEVAVVIDDVKQIKKLLTLMHVI